MTNNEKQKEETTQEQKSDQRIETSLGLELGVWRRYMNKGVIIKGQGNKLMVDV